MKDESDPITDDEWLLRRVRVEQFRTDKTPIISPNAFEPRVKGREPDTEGISLYREACLASPEEILATVAEDRRQEYAIVRIPLSLLQLLNLTASSAQDDQIKGHVVIPELNSQDYAADKANFTVIKLQLATVASEEENILKSPSST